MNGLGVGAEDGDIVVELGDLKERGVGELVLDKNVRSPQGEAARRGCKQGEAARRNPCCLLYSNSASPCCLLHIVSSVSCSDGLLYQKSGRYI